MHRVPSQYNTCNRRGGSLDSQKAGEDEVASLLFVLASPRDIVREGDSSLDPANANLFEDRLFRCACAASECHDEDSRMFLVGHLQTRDQLPG